MNVQDLIYTVKTTCFDEFFDVFSKRALLEKGSVKYTEAKEKMKIFLDHLLSLRFYSSASIYLGWYATDLLTGQMDRIEISEFNKTELEKFLPFSDADVLDETSDLDKAVDFANEHPLPDSELYPDLPWTIILGTSLDRDNVKKISPAVMLAGIIEYTIAGGYMDEEVPEQEYLYSLLHERYVKNATDAEIEIDDDLMKTAFVNNWKATYDLIKEYKKM